MLYIIKSDKGKIYRNHVNGMIFVFEAIAQAQHCQEMLSEKGTTWTIYQAEDRDFKPVPVEK